MFRAILCELIRMFGGGHKYVTCEARQVAIGSDGQLCQAPSKPFLKCERCHHAEMI